MKKLLLLASLFFLQFCATKETQYPNQESIGQSGSLDGLWKRESCKCNGKDTLPTGYSDIAVLLVHGNTIFQMGASHKTDGSDPRYCSFLNRSDFKKVDEKNYILNDKFLTIHHTDNNICNFTSSPRENRKWKIPKQSKTEFTFESEQRCQDGGLLVCNYKKMD